MQGSADATSRPGFRRWDRVDAGVVTPRGRRWPFLPGELRLVVSAPVKHRTMVIRVPATRTAMGARRRAQWWSDSTVYGPGNAQVGA